MSSLPRASRIATASRKPVTTIPRLQKWTGMVGRHRRRQTPGALRHEENVPRRTREARVQFGHGSRPCQVHLLLIFTGKTGDGLVRKTAPAKTVPDKRPPKATVRLLTLDEVKGGYHNLEVRALQSDEGSRLSPIGTSQSQPGAVDRGPCLLLVGVSHLRTVCYDDPTRSVPSSGLVKGGRGVQLPARNPIPACRRGGTPPSRLRWPVLTT